VKILGVKYGGQGTIDIDDLSNFANIIIFYVIEPQSPNNPLQDYGYLITFNKTFQILADYWGSSTIMFRTLNNGAWRAWHTFTMTD
jgi:hypothetical protein